MYALLKSMNTSNVFWDFVDRLSAHLIRKAYFAARKKRLQVPGNHIRLGRSHLSAPSPRIILIWWWRVKTTPISKEIFSLTPVLRGIGPRYTTLSKYYIVLESLIGGFKCIQTWYHVALKKFPISKARAKRAGKFSRTRASPLSNRIPRLGIGD